eukprot:TRINITY_DN10866_c0_g1_i1.p1 TRINITY_DN10866_c0_g1~~TRINITY_DN10866_c0_g1_i1.p1  ORF type:complete len:342 (+),score=15.69 TRINITY_DN10866_c0_g1_i1:73-1098(+)
MSSTGIPGGEATAQQRYFCYQCNRTVFITSSPTFDLGCPICHGGFLEELENPNPNPIPDPFSDLFNLHSSRFPPASSEFPVIFSTSGNIDSQNTIPNPFFRSDGRQDPDVFNPFMFLQNYLQTVMAGGANIQLVIDNNNSDRFPTNLGDYFIGPGLEQLIQQLAENDPNRYGTPPASKSAVETLPDVQISGELLTTDSEQCAVCKDTFELGTEAKQMPCKHLYHPDCILPWLALHNSCPVCRYELPTDDQDYENRTRGAPVNPMAAAVSDSSGSGVAQGDSPVTAERRFRRISLPWPFRAFGSSAETSGSGNNGGSNDGNTNAGNRENRDLDSETRQEDLD